MPDERRQDGRRRVVIENLQPEVDCGRFPIKRVLGETVVVDVDAFADGHDRVACCLRYRHAQEARWSEVEMAELGNDRWRAQFAVGRLGRYRYTVAAWVDPFLSWRHDFARREDDADIVLALQSGAELVEAAAERADPNRRQWLLDTARALTGTAPLQQRRALALDEELELNMRRYPDRALESVYYAELEVLVNRELARFSSWYELFPRSPTDPGIEHGTLRQCVDRLSYVADLGFDILYLPPIHPIGRENRKGPNNALNAAPKDAGSPWAIGSAEGGHKAVHPDLGTLADFRKLLAAAQSRGIEIALDIAFQCAPDHPYVREHPEWFRRRPDGSVQYAENPPKKYQDIYPFDFETADWRALWEELKSVFDFWIEQGVRIFRVDNPHTKAFPFWEWIIARIGDEHPDVIFLSEAFTRPRVMHRLAKLGFTQSYTYFTWRNTKHELVEYMTELTQQPSREYFQPNLWPNTPDILHEYLQLGGRPAFVTRVTLAATMAASYGIYGPAFELLERSPREPGSEEYDASEKYQVRNWDLDRPDSLAQYIGRLNRIRKENPALQSDWSLRFHPVDNHSLICYSKCTDDYANIILVVVNLDSHYKQSGFVDIPLHAWGMDEERAYQVHDLLSGARYLWHGPRNYVELDPQGANAHVFRVRRHVGTEKDFDYFM
jgi:starch synthase (maltosyl-transferring)